MNIICTEVHHDSRWHDLVDRLSNSVFHSQEWMRVIEKTYEFPVAAYLLLDEKEKPIAGVPFCQIEDLKSKRMVSLPFCDYCDPLVEDPVHWRHLVDRIQAEGCTFTIRLLHNDLGLTDDRLAVVNRAKWHGRCLCDDEDAIWQSLHNSARRAIRKAQKYEVDIQAAQSKQDLRSFYDLHLKIRKYKYRMVAQPYAFFENIWDHFVAAGNGQLLLAHCQGEIVAGVLLLVWRNTLYYKFNASSSRHLNARPNDLLLWEAMCYGKSRRLTYFDFGLSDWDQEGLISYKRKYAQDEKTITYLRTVDNQPTVQEKHLYQLLPQLTTLLTEDCVPDKVTERAGALLYRYFS